MRQSYLVWIDLEMTGLDLERDVILEIATIITDTNLTIVQESPALVINHPAAVLETMNDWCTIQHKKSGLANAVLESTTTLEQAEQQTLALITQYCQPKKGILCGNSVWQDRNFLHKYMPTIIQYLHYKLIDVSSFQQMIKDWYPNNKAVEFKKQDLHRALPDIRESIAELKHYKNNFFIPIPAD